MDREFARGPNALQPSSSANYLVYLFVISAAFVVAFPYLVPLSGRLMRSGSNKKVVVESKIRNEAVKKPYPSAYSTPTYSSLSSDTTGIQRVYRTDSQCDALEVSIVELQRTVQIEREKTLHLENEIRILQISERFLKDRVQTLEVRSTESRRDLPGSHTPSAELLMQTVLTQSKHGNLDALVHELLRMVQAEKDRTTSLEVELERLRKSEVMLIDRVQALEEKFAAYMVTQRQTIVQDGKNQDAISKF